MVLRHFLFLSSVTPTLNVDLGVGVETPAELFNGPCGTANAGSCRPSFDIEDPPFPSPEFDEVGDDPERCCFALENMSLALATPLLLRFLSASGLTSSRDFRGLPLTLLLFSGLVLAVLVSMFGMRIASD